MRWSDFVLDDIRGPLLDTGDQQIVYAVCRGPRLERPGVKEDDAEGKDVGDIQETSQSMRPARMAGQADLFSADVHAPDKEVGSGDRATKVRWHRRGEG